MRNTNGTNVIAQNAIAVLCSCTVVLPDASWLKTGQACVLPGKPDDRLHGIVTDFELEEYVLGWRSPARESAGIEKYAK